MSIEISVRPFDHQQGGDYPGSRGVVVDAGRPDASGIVFSTDLPTVFISDAGDVDVDHYRVPAEDLIAWMRAVEAQIREHLPELVLDDTTVRVVPSSGASA